MAYSVTRAREVDSVLGRDALKISMIVGVHEIRLQSVVIGVANAQLGFYSRHFHSLELKVSHSASSILGKRLIDLDAYLVSSFQVTVGEMSMNDLFS